MDYQEVQAKDEKITFRKIRKGEPLPPIGAKGCGCPGVLRVNKIFELSSPMIAIGRCGEEGVQNSISRYNDPNAKPLDYAFAEDGEESDASTSATPDTTVCESDQESPSIAGTPPTRQHEVKQAATRGAPQGTQAQGQGNTARELNPLLPAATSPLAKTNTTRQVAKPVCEPKRLDFGSRPIGVPSVNFNFGTTSEAKQEVPATIASAVPPPEPTKPSEGDEDAIDALMLQLKEAIAWIQDLQASERVGDAEFDSVANKTENLSDLAELAATLASKAQRKANALQMGLTISSRRALRQARLMAEL